MSDRPASPTTVGRLWQRARLPLLIYVICAGAYLGTAANRLRRHSNDNHYVYLAHNVLHGRLSLDGRPPHQNDWARVLELELRDGRRVRGAFLKVGGRHRFKTTRGERLEITPDKIRRRKTVYYVSFPWFPAALMLPLVAIFGMKFNDVIFTALVAALNPVLLFLLLGRLRALGYSARSVVDDLWLVGMFAFGTVHFFSSVMGQVWFTAHVVGVSLMILYAICALEGRHPLLAGLCLGLGFVTRPPTVFTFPLIVGEVLRRHMKPPADGSPAADPHHRPPMLWWIRDSWSRVELRPAFKPLLLATGAAVALGVVAMVINYLRFDTPFEFGHTYLNVRWAERIQRWGLFNYHFVARNLAVMLVLLPRIMTRSPYLQISRHGLSLFFTTPAFLFLLWPQRRSPIQPLLYLSCLLPIVLHLFYQNSGWVQFGYRFSLDYTVFLIALLAVGGHRLGWGFRALVLWGVGVNTFGAVTFNRMGQFYTGRMFPVR